MSLYNPPPSTPNTDTLDTVTTRGAITSNPITVGEVLTKESTTLGYTGSQLTSVTKASGSTKTLSYNGDGTLHSIVAVLGAETIIKTLSWSGGVLQSIAVS